MNSNKMKTLLNIMMTPFPVNTQHMCITFVQWWTNVKDVGPTFVQMLYKIFYWADTWRNILHILSSSTWNFLTLKLNVRATFNILVRQVNVITLSHLTAFTSQPNKLVSSSQCCFNVVTPSTTLTQRLNKVRNPPPPSQMTRSFNKTPCLLAEENKISVLFIKIKWHIPPRL